MDNQTLITALKESCKRHHCKLAIIDSQGHYTYKDLWGRVVQIGSLLIKLGVHRNERVILHMGNSCDFVIFYYAILYAGGVVCPLDNHLSSFNFLAQIRNISPNVAILSLFNFNRHVTNSLLADYFCSMQQRCIVAYELNADYETLPDTILRMSCWADDHNFDYKTTASIESSDFAQIVYTTGTTGNLKAVMLSHKQMELGILNIIKIAKITSGDTEITTLPLVRLFGQFHLHAYLRVGGTLIIEPNMLNPVRTLGKAIQYKATSFPQVISAFCMLMNDTPELFRECDNTLRYVMLCSMIATRAQLIRLQSFLPTTDIYNTYGLSEAVRCTAVNITKEPHKIGSVGKPTEGVQVEIADNEGNLLPPLETGEIIITSDHIFSGYWNNDIATVRTLVKGRLLTGDLGYIDTDGYVYYTGRKTDEINVGGQKFMPQEIEAIIKDSVEGVSEVVVIPIPDPDGIFGAVPLMFIQVNCEKKPTKRDIQRVLIGKVEPFKIPKYIEIVDDLPRSQSGKVLKHRLIMLAKTCFGKKENA